MVELSSSNTNSYWELIRHSETSLSGGIYDYMWKNVGTGRYLALNTSATSSVSYQLPAVSGTSSANRQLWNVMIYKYDNSWLGKHASQSYNTTTSSLTAASNLKVYVNSNATDANLTYSDYDTAIVMWNDMSKYLTLSRTTDLASANIIIQNSSQFSITGLGVAIPENNGTVYYPSGWNSLSVSQQNTILQSDWNRVYIYISLANFETYYNGNIVAKKAIIAHEIGHALKLMHPQEQGETGGPYSTFPSLMQRLMPTVSGTTITSALSHDSAHLLTTFDKAQLRRKWGRGN